jgi:hypothetical protein
VVLAVGAVVFSGLSPKALFILAQPAGGREMVVVQFIE